MSFVVDCVDYPLVGDLLVYCLPLEETLVDLPQVEGMLVDLPVAEDTPVDLEGIPFDLEDIFADCR